MEYPTYARRQCQCVHLLPLPPMPMCTSTASSHNANTYIYSPLPPMQMYTSTSPLPPLPMHELMDAPTNPACRLDQSHMTGESDEVVRSPARSSGNGAAAPSSAPSLLLSGSKVRSLGVWAGPGCAASLGVWAGPGCTASLGLWAVLMVHHPHGDLDGARLMVLSMRHACVLCCTVLFVGCYHKEEREQKQVVHACKQTARPYCAHALVII